MRRRARTRIPRTVPPGQLRRTLEAIRRFRTNFVFGTLMVLFVVLLGRLGKLQIVEGDHYRELAARRHESGFRFRRMRGRIVDRFGWPMATSRPMRTVAFDADPDVIRDPWTFAMQAAALLSGDPAAHEIEAKIERVRAEARAAKKNAPRYVVLRRRIEDALLVDRLDTVQAMTPREKMRVGLWGIRVESEERRRYPNGSAAAHVIGRVPPEAKSARVGIEGHCDAHLAGNDVRVPVRRDHLSRYMIDHEVDRAATRGSDVRLTIDLVVQHHLETALDELEANRPEDAPIYNACGVVIDPHSGEILAWANRPTRDLNARMQSASEALVAEMDWVIQGQYEPGSIFKPFTVAWGLEHGVIAADTILAMPAQISWPRVKMIHDSHYIGPGTPDVVIGQSSNTGVAAIAHDLGPRRMAALWRRLGLGHPTGVGFKNEAPTRALDPTKVEAAKEVWPGWLQHRAAFGQGFSVTPLQMAAGYCAFARNDARIVKPRIVVSRKAYDSRRGRLCDPKHLSIIRRGLEMCTQSGTARQAFEGAAYVAAGKTGTSQQRFRSPEGPLVETNVCTFVGHAPAHDPQVVVLVLAMVPRNTGSGGSVAAPAVRHVFDETLAYWRIDRGSAQADAPVRSGPRGPLMSPRAQRAGGGGDR